MELEVVEKRDNVLLQRTEVRFAAKHPGEKSPSREALRNEVAKAVGGSKETTIIDHARARYGMPITVGYAKVYKSKEAALRLERHHILVRNGLAQKVVKENKPEAAAPAAEAPKKEAKK